MPFDEGEHQMPLAQLSLNFEGQHLKIGPQLFMPMVSPYTLLVAIAALEPWRITWHRTTQGGTSAAVG